MDPIFCKFMQFLLALFCEIIITIIRWLSGKIIKRGKQKFIIEKGKKIQNACIHAHTHHSIFTFFQLFPLSHFPLPYFTLSLPDHMTIIIII
jgi:hypothetical protein